VAESFLCRGEWIDWSNGATKALFECWAAMATESADRPGMTAVAAYLRWSLDSSGPGNRAFGMDREVFPDTLAGPAEIAALLEVIQRTADDPCRIPDVDWTPELRARWSERLDRMAAAVRAAL
jgi:hypothetical protein